MIKEKKQIEENSGVTNSKLQAKRHTVNIVNATGITKEVSSLDLFGMGYPYHIRYYGEEYCMVTSDYGVLVFQILI